MSIGSRLVAYTVQYASSVRLYATQSLSVEPISPRKTLRGYMEYHDSEICRRCNGAVRSRQHNPGCSSS